MKNSTKKTTPPERQRSENKPRTDGIHKPLQAEMNKIGEEQRKVREEARQKAEVVRLATEEKKREAELREKFAGIYSYSDEIKIRHPDIPSALLAQIKASKTGGEAKRLVKDWLIEKEKTTLYSDEVRAQD